MAPRSKEMKFDGELVTFPKQTAADTIDDGSLSQFIYLLVIHYLIYYSSDCHFIALRLAKLMLVTLSNKSLLRWY